MILICASQGLFCNTAGDIAFNFEQRGKFLCIPLREPDGEHNQGFIVFSTSKACRGAKDILVSRVQSLAAMDRKDARKGIDADLTHLKLYMC